MLATPLNPIVAEEFYAHAARNRKPHPGYNPRPEDHIPSDFMSHVRKPVWDLDGLRTILHEVSPDSELHALRQWLLETAATGFDPCYDGPDEEVIAPEHRITADEKNILRAAFKKELASGRYIGPFDRESLPLEFTRAHPVFVRPKREQNAWRTISDYSSPKGNSVNDFLNPEAFPTTYAKWDSILQCVQAHYPNPAHMGVADIAKAFRNLALNPKFYHLFALVFDGKIYYDTCGGFGGRTTPGGWGRFSRLIEHVANKRAGAKSALKHWVDDYIAIAGSAAERDRQLYILIEVCAILGVDVKFSKLDIGTEVQYLGLIIDGVNLVVRLDPSRLFELRSLVSKWRRTRVALTKDANTLIGKLVFAGRAIRSARTFLRRMYDEVARNSHRKWFRPSARFRMDLRWMAARLNNHSGVSVIPDWHSLPEHCYTDASKLGGGGGVWRTSWFATDDWRGAQDSDKHIDELELMAAVWSASTFGQHWSRKTVVFHVDNEAVRGAMTHRTSSSPRLMYWLRCLYALEEHYGFISTCTRIAGVNNIAADAVSRRRIMSGWYEKLQSWRPDMDQFETIAIAPPSWSLML